MRYLKLYEQLNNKKYYKVVTEDMCSFKVKFIKEL